jgi:hypothetical protein
VIVVVLKRNSLLGVIVVVLKRNSLLGVIVVVLKRNSLLGVIVVVLKRNSLFNICDSSLLLLKQFIDNIHIDNKMTLGWVK